MNDADGNIDDLVAFAAAAIAAGLPPTILSAEPLAVRLVVSDGVEERSFLVALSDVEELELG